MSLTKQEIDALVDELLKSTYGLCRYNVSDGTYTRAGVREAAYLAAGLTAEGERKPERVRCWMVKRYDLYGPEHGGYAYMVTSDSSACEGYKYVTPGWFVPDGAE